MPVGGPEAGHREERAGRGGDVCADASGTMPERETPPGAEAVDTPPQQAPPPGRAEGPAGALLRVEDTTGRRLGSGFLADDRGTVVTAYEAVRDAAELLVGRADGAGGAGPVRIGADAVTSLPDRKSVV